MNASIPRPEHPRPDFMRDTFYNLNGVWQFAFDDENAGLRERWQRPGRDLGGRITVPFAYQTALSGIERRLLRKRMTAAGITPESAAVVFAAGTPLQQQLMTRIKHVNRYCAMQ